MLGYWDTKGGAGGAGGWLTGPLRRMALSLTAGTGAHAAVARIAGIFRL